LFNILSLAIKFYNSSVQLRGGVAITRRSCRKFEIETPLLTITKQTMTATIVWITLSSARESLVPVDWCCCCCVCASAVFWPRDVVSMAASWQRPAWPLTTLLWRLMTRNIRS